MKNLITIFVIFFSSHMFGQSESSFFAALKSNDITSLENYLVETVDFCIFEDQQILNKNKALEKLKNFFSNNKIVSIEVIHKGTSKDKSSQYKVAKISTAKDTFRLFVYTSGEIGLKTVKELRIDKF